MSGVKSGLYGSANVENKSTKTVSKGSSAYKLSDFIVASDPDTDTANKTIKEYWIGLVDTKVTTKDGKVTYTADSDSSTKTLNSVVDTTKPNFLQKLTATEFATAVYVPSTELLGEVGEQSIYAFVIDDSGTGVPDAIQRSGLVFQKIDTRDISVTVATDNAGKILKEGQKDSKAGDGTDFQTLTFTLKGGEVGQDVSIVIDPGADLDTDAPANIIKLKNV